MAYPQDHQDILLPLHKSEGQNFAPECLQDEEHTSTTGLLENGHRIEYQARRPFWFNPLVLALNLFIFAFSLILFFYGLFRQLHIRTECNNLHSAYSPALEEIDVKYEDIKFNGTLQYPSIYRGPPSLELDAAWDLLEGEPAQVMKITAEEALRLDKKPAEIARLSPEYGGGFMATIEFYHQIHCLNMLRKSLFRDYYNSRTIEFTDSESTIATHQSHCIEMLRQFIMCHMDVGLLTFQWVEGFSRPFPDFNTWHKCRDFDQVVKWEKDKELKNVPIGHKWKPMPEDMIHKSLP